MHAEPLISVIVPVYKVEPYLRRCLDSICNQSYRNLEIICVNDGSPDNSLAILEEYAARDSRITIINQENQGLGAARNTGIDAAHGEWVSGVDSDDWIEPDLYVKAVACMKEDIDIICYGAFVDGEVNSQKAADMQKDYDIDSAGETVMETFQQLQRVSVNFWSKIYRCSLLKKYRLRQPAGKRYEDVTFFMRSCWSAGKYRSSTSACIITFSVRIPLWGNHLPVMPVVWNCWMSWLFFTIF